jgi:hypothetical protein
MVLRPRKNHTVTFQDWLENLNKSYSKFPVANIPPPN